MGSDVFKAEEEFAQAHTKQIEQIIIDAGLLPRVQESLRLSYFTQFVEDYDFNPVGLALSPLIDLYERGNVAMKQAVRASIRHIRINAPSNGSTFVNLYINDALKRIESIDARERRTTEEEITFSEAFAVA
jgi:hypothetical protein